MKQVTFICCAAGRAWYEVPAVLNAVNRLLRKNGCRVIKRRLHPDTRGSSDIGYILTLKDSTK
jgi:hypothetical protein